MDRHSHIDMIVVEIRKRMRGGRTREQIITELSKHIPSDMLFICYTSAAIMERDYGRQIP